MKRLNKRTVVAIATDAILIVMLAVVFAVSFLPENIAPIYGGEKVSAIYNGNRANKNVSLMFNVYENTQVVNDILDLLNQSGVKATFFVGGCWADDNAETLKRIVGSGHELANHGYFHKDHKNLSYEKNREEIYLTGLIVNALCGATPTLFAPPSGSYSSDTLVAASELGYKVIMWSKDTIDWRDNDEQTLYNRATVSPQNGDLILMHPKQHTLNVLKRVIDFYKDAGFSLVTVSENIKDI